MRYNKADDIFNSLKLSTSQLKQYHIVKTKFDKYFVACWNVIFEWAKFNQSGQEESETVEIILLQYCKHSPNTVTMEHSRTKRFEII